MTIETTMKTKVNPTREIRALLIALKSYITPDSRASGDDATPGMQVTISTNCDGTRWAYQTGDNSFSGACYGHPYWSVVFLYPRSNCTELASEAWGELIDMVEEGE